MKYRIKKKDGTILEGTFPTERPANARAIPCLVYDGLICLNAHGPLSILNINQIALAFPHVIYDGKHIVLKTFVLDCDCWVRIMGSSLFLVLEDSLLLVRTIDEIYCSND